MKIYFYKCPTCGATKEIKDQHNMTNPPDKVVCGWRGCMDYAIRES